MENIDLSVLREKFISIYTENIKREGAQQLLDYLKSSKNDFFTARKPLQYVFIWGFSAQGDINILGNAFEMFPLAYALNSADIEASYFLERGSGKK